MHNLGALSLDSQPLKHSLKSEAASWKAHFSSNIHKKAAADLQVCVWLLVLGCFRRSRVCFLLAGFTPV